MTDRRIIISVIGGHDIDQEVEQLAHNIGELIAKMGCVLACGGLGGAMMAVCKGAKSAGGTTIGILPGKDKSDANPFVDIVLPTSIGYARNAIVSCAADIIIALPGSHGTRSEISYGVVFNRPIIDLGGWNIDGTIKAESLEDAEAKIKELVRTLKTGRNA